MSKLPTAEEFCNNSSFLNDIFTDDFNKSILNEKFIEFGKLCAEAALKNAYDCGRFKGWAISDDENVHKEIFVKNIMSRQSIK